MLAGVGPAVVLAQDHRGEVPSSWCAASLGSPLSLLRLGPFLRDYSINQTKQKQPSGSAFPHCGGDALVMRMGRREGVMGKMCWVVPRQKEGLLGWMSHGTGDTGPGE